VSALALVRQEPIAGKQPANDPSAEAATLTACMLQPECAALAMSIAGPDDFYSGAHREIAKAIVSLLDSSDETHATNVAVRLRETGRMAIVGGDREILDMMNGVPAIGSNVARYAGKVRDLAQVRRLAEGLHRVLAECYQPIPDVSAFLSHVDATIGNITRTSQGRGVATALSVAKDVARSLETTPVPSVTTGFGSLDKVATGFERCAFYILAGRAGMGKTAMAMQMVVAAAEAGHTVLVESLEMPRQQLVRRIACGRARISVQAIKQRAITPSQMSAFVHAASEIARLPIFFADAPGQTLLDIKASVRAHKPALVVVDHIGLIKSAAGSSSARRSREQEVAEFSRGLKALALESQIPVMALCQVGREVAKAARRPTMSDLRESGAIEQDADGIWMIHRPGYYDPQASPEVKREAELIVAKQRDGETGILPLIWNAPEFSVPHGNDGTDSFGL
jgi:replicative DNA helicase